MPDVDHLRDELRNLGYLSHGLERWFSHDPWKSGTFWTELLLVSSKASLVIALFATVAATTAMVLHNGGLPLLETAVIALLYLVTSFAGAMTLHVLVALSLKTNPAFGIDNPRALMIIAMTLSGVVAVVLVAWWSAFPSDPGLTEQISFIALLVLLFVASSIVISAALLSFSIHETRSIPRIHRKPRTIPLAIGAFLLLVLILGRACTNPRAEALLEAPQVIVRATDARIALVAVDGLTPELFELRPELRAMFGRVSPVPPLPATSAPEAWATIGTGTPPALHGVRSVEGISFLGRRRVLQNVSTLDLALRAMAPAMGIAQRQPLPPSVRNRHFVWESLAERGVPAVAVNWWTSELSTGPLNSISQESIFAGASADAESPAALALEIDETAIDVFREQLREDRRFVTIYLPALDVILNRISVPEQTKLAGTIRALDQISMLIDELASGGWSLILVGTPGEGDGRALIASTIEIDLADAGLRDIAPTILALYGFPPSLEMPGDSLAGDRERITSYGTRESDSAEQVSDDYYENLKSLGYIQ